MRTPDFGSVWAAQGHVGRPDDEPPVFGGRGGELTKEVRPTGPETLEVWLYWPELQAGEVSRGLRLSG